MYTSLFESHTKETYFMTEGLGVVLLLVGEHSRMDLDPSCCISFSGGSDPVNSANKILDLLNE